MLDVVGNVCLDQWFPNISKWFATVVSKTLIYMSISESIRPGGGDYMDNIWPKYSAEHKVGYALKAVSKIVDAFLGRSDRGDVYMYHSLQRYSWSYFPSTLHLRQLLE